MKQLLIKDKKVIYAYPDSHIFSDKEKYIFEIKKIEDSEFEKIEKEISDYFLTNKAIGGIKPEIIKYYDGSLTWQIA